MDATGAHHHEPFPIPPDPADVGGRTFNYELLAELMAAAFDGCITCQDPLTTLLIEDADTACRLVGLTCLMVHDLLGGLPAGLLRQGAFGQLASAGVDRADVDGMFTACQQMPAADRREAVNTALDLLAGGLSAGGARG